ncbi:MAG: glycoside hydrolase family 3 C-terminal domain-containing protein [Armatimonadota bacterium]
MALHPWLDTTLPIPRRAQALLDEMQLAEKVSQLCHESPAIDRLGVPAYNWWNECLHGVARAGFATVFPQAIGLAASFNPELLHRVATAISDEGRAKHHAAAAMNDRSIYKGLTFWTPNINIFRDPRWGRGQETYGECPTLTALLGVAFVKGLQGDDPEMLKAAACAKHFAVHSGPESLRHGFNAVVSPKQLEETYLPAFRALVQEAKVEAVMGAYNRVNGEACCASPTLLQQTLRDQWGFEGHVVSDCWAINDIFHDHGLAPDAPTASAMAIKAGCDLCCGEQFCTVQDAVIMGLISEDDIDKALMRLLMTRLKLGLLDEPQTHPYTKISMDVVECEDHTQLNFQAARQSVVLLKNTNRTLPLQSNPQTIAVIGPNATDNSVLLGNYNGTPSHSVNLLEGITQLAENSQLLHSAGCAPAGEVDQAMMQAALDTAQASDVIIFACGLNPSMEGEEGDAAGSDANGDRERIELPACQSELLKQLVAIGKPVVVVNISGSAVALPECIADASSVMQCFYPGAMGGLAIAEVIFGKVNPSGRLPVTFYASTDQLPGFSDYSMTNRTYRYFRGTPQWPFGFGLSYTSFIYSDLILEESEAGLAATVTVTNTGDLAGDEVVQMYIMHRFSSVDCPRRQLVAVGRVHLKPGEKEKVKLFAPIMGLTLVDDTGERFLEADTIDVFVGGSQPDSDSLELGAPIFTHGEFIIMEAEEE